MLVVGWELDKQKQFSSIKQQYAFSDDGIRIVLISLLQ